VHDLEECKTFLDRKNMTTQPVAQELCQGDHHRANPDSEDQMDDINMIFGGNMSVTSKTQDKKLEREIGLAQRIELERRMKWSDTDILFRPRDNPKTELSNQNWPFVVKLLIGRHKVAKILVDNGVSLNLIRRKTFIEMGLNLTDLTLVYDTFHGVILGQSSTPIGCINLEACCGTGDNKHREMLTFEVTTFDIGYNCILGRPFLLMFMAVIHTAYATMKMSGSKGIITIKTDQQDALACEKLNCLMLCTSTTRQLRSNRLKWPKHRVLVLLSRHQHPSHRQAVPLELLQQGKALMLPQHLKQAEGNCGRRR
jgi:hypothetical protein